MSESENEVYKQHRTAQDKYTYFLLAAAVAGIGFAVQRTDGSLLEWSMIPLGAAVLSWAASFCFGCAHLNWVQSTLYANLELLKVESGMHPEVPQHQDYIEAAAQGIRDAVEENNAAASRFANWQFRLLILGAILFVVWHVVGMAQRTTQTDGITTPPPIRAILEDAPLSD